MEHFASDIKSSKESLKRIQKYILNKSIIGDKANKVKDLEDIGEVAWGFILALYKSQWDNLIADKNGLLFRYKVKAQFNPLLPRNVVSNKSKNTNKTTTVSTLSPSILAKSPKEVVEILKFFKKNSSIQEKKSYAQVLPQNINMARDTLRIKEAFPNLQNKKIKNIQKIISSEGKPKPHLNMTTKGSSWKQVIVSMNTTNTNNFMNDSSTHVTNINRVLKNIKSEVMADFIHMEKSGLVITTNKIASNLDLQTIKKYVKNLYSVDAYNVKSLRLPQSKSFLKIISILYISENTNSHITSDEIEGIIKANYIFNNIVLASKPRVIKVLPKSEMSIIWIDIWDTQSRVKAKGLINRCFNVGRYITTIRGMNMNPRVPQCKNCWK